MNKFADIYENDFHAWIQSQIRLLKIGKTSELDIEHLIEELEDMGKSNIRELESRFLMLIAHLLKWQFQLATMTMQWKEFEGKSWRKTIIEQRTQILYLLEDIPSLKTRLEEIVLKTYPKAVKFAIDETNLPQSTFPEQCPYSVKELLDKRFYP